MLKLNFDKIEKTKVIVPEKITVYCEDHYLCILILN
jgi:hypothetical protein